NDQGHKSWNRVPFIIYGTPRDDHQDPQHGRDVHEAAETDPEKDHADILLLGVVAAHKASLETGSPRNNHRQETPQRTSHRVLRTCQIEAYQSIPRKVDIHDEKANGVESSNK